MPQLKPGAADSKAKETIEDQMRKSVQDSQKILALRGMQKLEKTTIKELADGIVRYAYTSRASDIHVEPEESFLVIRYRIDGILHDVLLLPKAVHAMLITRVKVLSELRTDAHLEAQDGRFRLVFDDMPVDVRVSITPTYHGENIVMRLLVGQAKSLALHELGMSERDLGTVENSLRKSYGMILATGPTGSGKTTTLYSILQVLNTRQRSIITIEDPIEYAMAGVTQIPVNVRTNLTFAQGLRSIVRQDPNIIMVGEIRDQETAGIAVNAAMTGHLLLSTLHTNDAAVTLPRLLDMGIEPVLIASTVNVAIGQRLVRKLCRICATKRSLTVVERSSLKNVIPPDLLMRTALFAEPVGCKDCNNTGYSGRIGIYEVMEITEQIRHMIMQRENADGIRQAAVLGGMTTMVMDGVRKAADGVTSIAEVLRVIQE